MLSEIFCKLCFLEQVMFCDNRGKKRKKKDWKITCKGMYPISFYFYQTVTFFHQEDQNQFSVASEYQFSQLSLLPCPAFFGTYP